LKGSAHNWVTGQKYEEQRSKEVRKTKWGEMVKAKTVFIIPTKVRHEVQNPLKAKQRKIQCRLVGCVGTGGSNAGTSFQTPKRGFKVPRLKENCRTRRQGTFTETKKENESLPTDHVKK